MTRDSREEAMRETGIVEKDACTTKRELEAENAAVEQGAMLAEGAQGTHESRCHAAAERHHHHSHANDSRHEGGHHLLQVEDLSVSFEMYETDAPFFRAKKQTVRTIENLSVSVHYGEIVAIVGASGSGKTLLADAVMGMFEPNALVEGRIWFDGVRQDAAGLARLRGRGVSLVPQSTAHLDPLMKVGRQVRGVARTREERFQRAERQAQLFARYGLAPEVADLYPHELSGGMARRVLLCCALMDNPKLIVADEPTPGLDLDLAVRALDDFRAFANEGGGVLLITHDIELALRVADRIAVFKEGTVVEETAVANFADPHLLQHPFTRALWHALPEHEFASGNAHDEARSPACPANVASEDDGASRSCQRALEARSITFGHDPSRPLYRDFSLTVEPGERVALAAPSGFGKTTLCRLLAGYEVPQQGSVLVDGEPLPRTGACPVQLIGQRPEETIDPLARMEAALEEAGEVDARLREALGIKTKWLRRYPHELSGGELQRFCIARALAASPRYLIADEISTMLDAVTQAQLWEFLRSEVKERGLGLVFVSHNPALVERIATRVVNLEKEARAR